MYAWEKPFQAVVKVARAYELSSLKKSIFIRSVFLGFMMFTERLILFITCLTLILSGTNVTATLVSCCTVVISTRFVSYPFFLTGWKTSTKHSGSNGCSQVMWYCIHEEIVLSYTSLLHISGILLPDCFSLRL